nr:methyl-accepting chemotaxis protein [Pseudomonas sp. JV449]
MLKTLSRVLANISVMSKLSIGFGLIIILTVLIAYTGYSGISIMNDRSERIGDISKLGALTRDIRIERLSYILNSDQEHALSWLNALDLLESHVDKTRLNFNVPVNISLFDLMKKVLVDYRSQYFIVVKGTEAREATRDLRARFAESAKQELDKLEVFANGINGNSDLRSVLGVTTAQYNKMRLDVREYTFTRGKSAQDRAQDSLAALLENVKSLESYSFPAESLKVFESTLVGFQNTLNSLASEQLKIDQAQSSISADIKILLDAADKLNSTQIMLRKVDIHDAEYALAIGLAIALIISVFAAFIIARLIITPLLLTVSIAEKVANGDLTYDQPPTRRDELGRLQNSMQKMTLNLRLLMNGLKDGVVQIASAAEELSAVTEQTSVGVQNQRVETDQVATAMNQMAATVQEVALNAEHASAAAVAASKETRSGDELVAKSIDIIEKLANEVDNSMSAMANLKLESDKIGGVLDVIKSVAEQTNLLALNAAIEAARAGEAGRGFAVVADEVRSLAQRTQTSTEEIASLIQSLHIGTDKVATILGDSQVLVESSVEFTRQTGLSLGSISRSVSEIELLNHQIATSVEEQSAVAEEINRSILHVRDISEQTAAASEETASSSTELARLGVQLQTMIGKFSV